MKCLTNLVLILTVFIWSCGGSENKAPELTDSKTVSVKLAEVQQQELTTEIKGAGLLSSTREARLSFKTGGIIQKIFVEEGDRVSRGQLLATLNLTEINLQVAQYQEGLAKAKRDYQRAQNLYQDSIATQEQWQNAETALRVAQQNLEIAQYNQSYSAIYSTVDGVVVRKLMNEGEITSPGSPLFFINSTGNEDWVLKIGVADKDWVRVEEGNPAKIQLDAYPDITFEGTVKTLSQGADQSTGSYQIEIKVNPKQYKLATGMFGKAAIQTNKVRRYHLIPVESLVEGSGKEAFVFIPNGKKTKKISVTVEHIRGNKALISHGLDDVSKVIAEGAGFLSENSSITIR